MYIYIKVDDRGVVIDYDHDDSGTWSMKFYDRATTNKDLESKGYIKTYLMQSEYQIFEKYHDLYTYSENSLHQPFNVVEPSNEIIQSQLGTISKEYQESTAKTNELTALLKEYLNKE